jgi:hypothetical protein
MKFHIGKNIQGGMTNNQFIGYRWLASDFVPSEMAIFKVKHLYCGRGYLQWSIVRVAGGAFPSYQNPLYRL